MDAEQIINSILDYYIDLISLRVEVFNETYEEAFEHITEDIMRD